MATQRNPFHSVTEYVAWDHDGQEDVLVEARDTLDGGDALLAFKHFEVYERRLLRHMRIEETILFPLVESLVAHAANAVAEMRHEHLHIRRILAAMRNALAAPDLEQFRHSFDELGLVLWAHEAREERLIYPVLDRSLSPEQRTDLAKRLADER
jgi:iron-sulfur cluster repair protein YtfE (RIC family)